MHYFKHAGFMYSNINYVDSRTTGIVEILVCFKIMSNTPTYIWLLPNAVNEFFSQKIIRH